MTIDLEKTYLRNVVVRAERHRITLDGASEAHDEILQMQKEILARLQIKLESQFRSRRVTFVDREADDESILDFSQLSDRHVDGEWYDVISTGTVTEVIAGHPDRNGVSFVIQRQDGSVASDVCAYEILGFNS